jgi:hypothetical protein
MGRTMGSSRVVPTAEAMASSSRSSVVDFTPVLPVNHVADDPGDGAASGARYREDGQEYVSHLTSSMRSTV